MTTPRHLVTTGAILGALAVAAGAFGAHALRDTLLADQFRTFETAARYHLIHALATGIAGISAELWHRSSLIWSGRLFVAGTVLFSGSLYLLAFGSPRILGAITPLGGVCFIAGWLFLAVGAVRGGE